MSFRQECSVVAAAHTVGAATECKETAEKRCKENNGEKTRKRDFCYPGPVFDFFCKPRLFSHLENYAQGDKKNLRALKNCPTTPFPYPPSIKLWSVLILNLLNCQVCFL